MEVPCLFVWCILLCVRCSWDNVLKISVCVTIWTSFSVAVLVNKMLQVVFFAFPIAVITYDGVLSGFVYFLPDGGKPGVVLVVCIVTRVAIFGYKTEVFCKSVGQVRGLFPVFHNDEMFLKKSGRLFTDRRVNVTGWVGRLPQTIGYPSNLARRCIFLG